jgi:PAS domain S-box-containing protein
MSIIAPDGKTYLAVNPLLCKMFGHTREEILGETLYLVTHPDDEEISRKWIRKKMAGEPHEPEIEKRYIHRDGHTIWGRVSAQWLKNADGSPRMAIAHIQDITDQKKKEKERMDLQAKLTASMELAHLAHWDYDAESDAIILNDQVYKIFKTSFEEIGSYSMSSEELISRFILPDDQYIIRREIRNILQASDPGFNNNYELRFLYADGATGYLKVHYLIEKDGQGRTIRASGIIQDITGQKLAEEERKKLEGQVRHAQKMETIGVLAGGVAHDFNNLLTPIVGYSDILDRYLPDDDNRKKYVRDISLAATRAKDVVQRLLAFSRKQMLEVKTVDMGKTVRQFSSILRQTIRENIDIRIDGPPEPCLIKADSVQIEQVLLNLSINAQDAMPDGGCLSIGIEGVVFEQAVPSEYQDASPGPYVRLTVSDTGVGIDKENVGKIFEPFFTSKGPGKGTGLGLSTAYGIVRQHAGAISVSSEKDRGTTFTVVLPRVEQDTDGQVEKATCRPDGIDGGHETIMVVEDNTMVRKLTCDMLSEMGYNVLMAKDPEAGLDLAQNHRGVIHLLLTDIVMPQKNGKELYGELKELRPDVKVVFMSGYASDLLEQEDIVSPKHSFIQKPFSFNDLSGIVRDALNSPTS